MSERKVIEQPYLLFLGDAHDQLAAKTAQGIADWRPESCVGQYRLTGCNADLGLTDLTLTEAVEAGARTLVVGVANRGGVISHEWVDILEKALIMGLDLAAGLHNRLADVPSLAAVAEQHGRQLFDVRHPTREFQVANGEKRAGKRLIAMMKLGMSRPWPDALAALTGKRKMDATAILSYFEPLQKWLGQQNKGRTCGW